MSAVILSVKLIHMGMIKIIRITDLCLILLLASIYAIGYASIRQMQVVAAAIPKL